MSGSEVTLHLDRSRTSRSFDVEESLWEKEFQRIAEILKGHLEMIGDGRQTPDKKPPHLALAIYGGYGSGKTSLLATLSELANRDKPINGFSELEDIRNKIHALPILRPNVLAEGESFLYAFLAAVLREKPEQRSTTLDEPQPLLSGIEQSIQKVIGCLQVLDRADTSPEHDPIGASVARLERHASDRDLKDALDELITELAKRLAKNEVLLLQPIDDADLSREDLFRTLDTLRRYLAHPRLVPICSFNGRLAEELLVSHFSSELQRQDNGTGTEWLRFEEEIALQYLARMFPVRNRIRLGATMVRVQRAEYLVRTESVESSKSVSDLLKHGSKVLYGVPEPLVEPRTKLALRPSLLRRQLQILDALHDAGVEELFTKDGGPASQDACEGSKNWMVTFERLTWSFLDAHRDVLKELGIHLEDLYSWSFKRLREWILAQLVNLESDRRGLLIEHWVYRTENRRGQVLSLLAAYAFRPALGEDEQMPGEEPIGLDRKKSPRGQGPLDTSHMYIWFLSVWLGFYLPQILFRDRKTDGDRRTGSDRRSHGGRWQDGDCVSQRIPASWVPMVGWDLGGAPALAIHEALKNRDLFGPGMMFIDVKEMAKYITEEKENNKHACFQIVVNLWCFYGYEGGEPWCAISLWRGLSLIAQLLQLRDTKFGDGSEKTDLRWRIEYLLHRHFFDAHQPGSVRTERDHAATSDLKVSGNKAPDGASIPLVPFPFYRRDSLAGSLDPERGSTEPPWGYPEGTPASLDKYIKELADEIEEWLRNDYEVYDPLSRSERRRDDGHGDPLWAEKRDWKFCLLRRLHGEDMLGVWWPSLQNVYAEIDKFRPASRAGMKGHEIERRMSMNALEVMTGWKYTLERFWSKDRKIGELVDRSPVMQPPNGEEYDRQLEALEASPSFPLSFEGHEETKEEPTPKKPKKAQVDGAGRSGK